MLQHWDEGGGGNSDGSPGRRPKCVFCGVQAASVEAAIDAGWAPDVWAGETNYAGPVCRPCLDAHFVFNEEYGDYELQPGRALPPGARPLGPNGAA